MTARSRTHMGVIASREGHLDVLVNNAGISTANEITGPEALKVFDTNAIGLIRVTQAALPLFGAIRSNPVVVNVSSALGSFWAVTDPERRQFHFPAIIYGTEQGRCIDADRSVRQSSSRYRASTLSRPGLHRHHDLLNFLQVGQGSRSKRARKSSFAWPPLARTCLPRHLPGRHGMSSAGKAELHRIAEHPDAGSPRAGLAIG